MSNWIEEQAASLREQSGGDVGRLTELLAPLVMVRASHCAAVCFHLPDGRSVIYAPGDYEMLHEVGHALGTAGLGTYLEAAGAPWARVQIWREEAIANRFRAAFLKDD